MNRTRFKVIRQESWDGSPFFLVFDPDHNMTVGPRHETWTDALDYIHDRVNPPVDVDQS
jgi:hypothetical protein